MQLQSHSIKPFNRGECLSITLGKNCVIHKGARMLFINTFAPL